MPMLFPRPVEDDLPTFMVGGMRHGEGRKALTEASAMSTSTRSAEWVRVLNMLDL